MLPLLLTDGTRGARAFTVRPCLLHNGLSNDPEEVIYPECGRGNGFVMLMPPLAFPDTVPAPYRNWPSVCVDTTPDWVWKLPVDEHLVHVDAYCSYFLCRERAGFERAYRVARCIAAGRPACDALHTAGGQVWSVVAPAHARLLSLELMCDHISAEAMERMGEHSYAEPSACRCCGRDDYGMSPLGGEWSEPDLCNACVGRETHGPCVGFSGTCDRCNETSTWLLLRPLSQFAECPSCSQKATLGPRRGTGGRGKGDR